MLLDEADQRLENAGWNLRRASSVSRPWCDEVVANVFLTRADTPVAASLESPAWQCRLRPWLSRLPAPRRRCDNDCASRNPFERRDQPGRRAGSFPERLSTSKNAFQSWVRQQAQVQDGVGDDHIRVGRGGGDNGCFCSSSAGNSGGDWNSTLRLVIAASASARDSSTASRSINGNAQSSPVVSGVTS